MIAPATRCCQRGTRELQVILQTMLPLLALIPISMVQLTARHAVVIDCAGLLLALWFLYFGLKFVLQRSRGAVHADCSQLRQFTFRCCWG